MWEVEEGGRIRRYSDRLLERLLRDGELTGAERARRDGGHWIVLHQTEIFRRGVPGGGGRQVALQRVLGPLALHAAALLGAWMLYGHVAWLWSPVFIAHLAREFPKLRALMGSGAAARRSAETPSELAPPSAFDEAASALMADLGTDDPALAEEVRKLDDAGRILAQRIKSLRALVAQQEAPRLEREAERLRSSLADDRADVTARELAALEERLKVLADAQGALARLEAEERSLVHQIEGLRLALARAELASTQVPDLLDQVRDVRLRTEAEADLDAELARARTAT